MLDTVRNYSIGTFTSGSPIVFFVWGLPYSSNRHVTPVSVRGRKGLTCSIRAPHCPRFNTLRQSVSNRAQLFLAVYIPTRHGIRYLCHADALHAHVHAPWLRLRDSCTLCPAGSSVLDTTHGQTTNTRCLARDTYNSCPEAMTHKVCRCTRHVHARHDSA